MSDFLGRLVQRSLTTSPSEAGRTGAEAGLAKLTPRLPSLFETPGGEVTAPEAASPTPEEARPPDDNRRETEEPGPSRTLASPAPALVQPLAGNKTGPPAATPLGLPSFADGMADGKDGETELPRPLAIQSLIIHHEPTEGERSSDESGAATAAPARLVPVPRSAPAPLSGEGGRHVEVGGRQVEVGGSASLGAARGTIVRINIGRIEVRAVHPVQPAAMPRKIAPTPRLTLEEYAKQRNEGKR